MGEIITLQRGFDLPTTKRNSGTIPVISSGGQSGYHDNAKVKGPGVVTGRYGSIGSVYFIEEPFWPLNTTLFVSNFNGNHPKFIYYLLQTIDFRRYSDKTGVPGVNRNDLHLIKVINPKATVQEKIAAILSAWDTAIDQTRKLIAAKKKRKKALMQKLLEAELCFTKREQDTSPIKALVSPVSRPFPKPKEPYLAIGLRSHGKGTFQRIVEEPDKVAMDTLYRIEKDDIIVNITFAWEGAIAIANGCDEGGLVSHRFPTFRVKENADLSFLRQLFLTKRFVWDLGLISPGGAGRNRVLNKTDFMNLKVFAPSIEVQKMIGLILSIVDNEIELLENKLAALEKQKRGLMQKLLTGEVRVKV